MELDVLIDNAGFMATQQSILDMDYDECMTSFAVNADLDVPDSAAGLLEVIEGLTLKDTRRFLDYEGKTLPW